MNPPQVEQVPKANTISKWWPIGLGIAVILLYITGGALAGAACSTDEYYCDTGLWSGGVALCSIASIVFIAFIIMLIVWAVKRKNGKAHWNAATGFIDARNFQSGQQNPPMESVTYQVPKGVAGRFCGQCGNTVSSAFCPRCGANVPGV